jgi:hypothetical protein
MVRRDYSGAFDSVKMKSLTPKLPSIMRDNQ